MFGEYVFSMKVVSSQDCGIVYDYLDYQNYYFIYLNVKSKAIVMGQVKDGKTQDLRSVAFVLPSSFSVRRKTCRGF